MLRPMLSGGPDLELRRLWRRPVAWLALAAALYATAVTVGSNLPGVGLSALAGVAVTLGLCGLLDRWLPSPPRVPSPPPPPLWLSGAGFEPEAAARMRSSLRSAAAGHSVRWVGCPACGADHFLREECVEQASDAELLGPARSARLVGSSFVWGDAPMPPLR
jgi:multisubunit Na+/H+ antiporter MnhB subunit